MTTLFAKITLSDDTITYGAVVAVRDYYRHHKYSNAETRDVWSLHHHDGVPVKFIGFHNEIFCVSYFDIVEPITLPDFRLNGERLETHRPDIHILGSRPEKHNVYCGGKVEHVVWYTTPSISLIPDVRVGYAARDERTGLLCLSIPG
jgi:hypothetical protein